MPVETLLEISSFVLQNKFIQIWYDMRSVDDDRIEESF